MSIFNEDRRIVSYHIEEDDLQKVDIYTKNEKEILDIMINSYEVFIKYLKSHYEELPDEEIEEICDIIIDSSKEQIEHLKLISKLDLELFNSISNEFHTIQYEVLNLYFIIYGWDDFEEREEIYRTHHVDADIYEPYRRRDVEI